MFNINSDTQTGTFPVNSAADLTVGSHTVSLSASLFPDPNPGRFEDLYSLVVVDPQRNVADNDRFDNVGVLSGVTQTPDGTLSVTGNPFTSNTITITNTSVTFNGTPITYTAASINDIFILLLFGAGSRAAIALRFGRGAWSAAGLRAS